MKNKLGALTVLFSFRILAAAIPVQPGAVLFENDQVKVIRAWEKPHVKSKFHDHKLNRVMIYCSRACRDLNIKMGVGPT